MFLHNVKEYDILQLIMCFIQKKPPPQGQALYMIHFSPFLQLI